VNSNEACRTTHQLYDANAIGPIAGGLRFGTSNGILGGFNARCKTKRPVNVVNVVLFKEERKE